MNRIKKQAREHISFAGAASSLIRWLAIVLIPIVIGAFANHASAASSASYYYDELGRLIETVASDGSSVVYAYDAVGNILSLKHNAATTVGVSGFVPASGPAGTSVSIFGSGFNTTAANNAVKFNGVAATVTAATATTLTVTVPTGATTGAISVANGAASATSALAFSVSALGVPTIASFTPTIAAQGTGVSVTGTNFQVATATDKLLFGNVSAPVTTATASNLTTKVPAPASSGKISITTPFGTATSTNDFFAVPPGFNVADVQYTGRMAISGSTLTATTSVTGKTALVIFDGAAGQTGEYLNLSNVSMPGGTLTIFGPDGEQVFSTGISNGTVSLPTLPFTGTYTTVLAPSGAGSATLQIGPVNLKISGLTVNAINANQDGSWGIQVTYTVTNVGTIATQSNWSDTAYLSTDGTLSNDDIQAVPGVLNSHAGGLAAGASYVETNWMTVGNASTPVGNYTAFVKADGHNNYTGGTATDGGNVTESDETDNAMGVPVTLGRPDLKISGLTVSGVIANQDGSWGVQVNYTVTNVGALAAQPGWSDTAYLSTDATLSNDDIQAVPGVLASHNSALAPGASYSVTNWITVGNSGTLAGNYTVFVKTDGHNNYTGGTATDGGNIFESDETNNAMGVPVTLGRPDLKISGLTVSGVISNQDGSWGVQVNYTVTNVGTLAAQPGWSDTAYLSTDAILSNDDIQAVPGVLASHNSALAPGASYSVTNWITVGNSSTPAGNYTVFVKADGHNNFTGGTATDGGNIFESDETNNAMGAPVTLARPDLQISGLTAGSVIKNQDGSWGIQVSYVVTNIGSIAAQPGWSDTAYLSTDATLSNDDIQAVPGVLASHTTALAPGASYTVTNYITVGSASTPAGTYTVFVKADGHNNVTGGTPTDGGNLVEANESNNSMGVPIVLSH